MDDKKKSSGKSFLEQIVSRNEDEPTPKPAPPPAVTPPPAESKPVKHTEAKPTPPKPVEKKPARKAVPETSDEAGEGIDKERITMYLDRELIHKLKLYAVNHRQRYSTVVNDALLKHLGD